MEHPEIASIEKPNSFKMPVFSKKTIIVGIAIAAFVIIQLTIFSLQTKKFTLNNRAAEDQILYPSQLLRNYKQWKITLPDGTEVKNLAVLSNEYFYTNNERAIIFKTPIRENNGTTPNSSNIRSELRERTLDGKVDIYWTTTGKHVLYVKQAITHLPIKVPVLVASQVHGNKSAGIDDAMVLRLEKDDLLLSFNGGKLRSDALVKTDAGATGKYTLGTMHEVIFEIEDGKHVVYYSEDGNLYNAYSNGNADIYSVKENGNKILLVKNYGEAYFKAGNYTQSNKEREGD